MKVVFGYLVLLFAYAAWVIVVIATVYYATIADYPRATFLLVLVMYGDQLIDKFEHRVEKWEAAEAESGPLNQ